VKAPRSLFHCRIASRFTHDSALDAVSISPASIRDYRAFK
jgi:hypothetical protein